MTITSERVRVYAVPFSNACCTAVANHNLEEGTWDLEFHARPYRGILPVIKELVPVPIAAHNEKSCVLELREPSYDEIEAIGFPFTALVTAASAGYSSVALKYIPVLEQVFHARSATCVKLIFQSLYVDPQFSPVGDARRSQRAQQHRILWRINPPEPAGGDIRFSEASLRPSVSNEEMKHG